MSAWLTVFALLAPQDADLILVIKYCQGLDRDSWEWLLKMCFLYERSSTDALAAIASIGVALLSAKLLRWFAGAR